MGEPIILVRSLGFETLVSTPPPGGLLRTLQAELGVWLKW
jgi:hypothetical protein